MWIASNPSDQQMATIQKVLSDYTSILQKKLTVLALPTNQYLSDRIVDRVRTSPSVNASGRLLLKASHFDTAFIVEDLLLYNLEGGLSGFFFSLIIIN